MIKKILLLLLISATSYSQLVINELDCDQASTDTQEFIEIKSVTPFYSLDGYVLVFFNAGGNATTAGTSTLSYLSFDLDGATTDVNGLFTLGNNDVSPQPNRTFTNNLIGNGADAVGLYLTNLPFPTNTPATTINLIDALVYDTNDLDAVNLLTALGETVQWNEAINGNALGQTQSLQRKADGTYEAKTPTPSANNDGSGTLLNSLSAIVTPTGNLTEGNTFTITFSTQTVVTTSDLIFNYNLVNDNFNTSDFSGNLSVSIPVGTTSIIKTIILTDDALNEGDETMLINIGTIPNNYTISSNNIQVRIHDNDNLVIAWGNPLTPSYGLCANTKPAGYYDSLEGKTGAVLKQAIQDIIANPAVVREHTYADAFDMLLECDTNPNNSSQVWLLYDEEPRSKLDIQTGASGFGRWNREHIYPQSRGAFNLDSSLPNDGINFWTTTDANDITAGGSDGHHIRAEDGPENSSRNNRNYGVDYNGPTGNAGSWHGDVARAVFYMCVRYNGLNVVNGNVAEVPTGNIGDLATLLTWNIADRSDDFEMNHNNIIYNWQKNRNPFVDYPELANYIWGANVGQPWSALLSTKEDSSLNFNVYPNPTDNHIFISGLTSEAKIEIYNVTGFKVFASNYKNNEQLNTNLPSGMYLIKVTEDQKTAVKKLIIR